VPIASGLLPVAFLLAIAFGRYKHAISKWDSGDKWDRWDDLFLGLLTDIRPWSLVRCSWVPPGGAYFAPPAKCAALRLIAYMPNTVSMRHLRFTIYYSPFTIHNSAFFIPEEVS
jgi:hypothetical protein